MNDTLHTAVTQAHRHTFFYNRLFRKAIARAPSEASSDYLKWFQGLPFTSKDDVVKNFPNGFKSETVVQPTLYCESSGTSGNTVHSTKSASFFSKDDIRSDLSRRYSPDLKLSPRDIVLNTLPMAYTSSGIMFQMAAMEAGAMVICADGGSLLSSHLKHLDSLRDLGATIFITPLPLLYSTLVMLEGKDPKEEFPTLRAIQLCGLPTLPAGLAKIRQMFGVPVYNTYGLSEFGAVTYTCSEGHMHVADSFYVEVINPRNGDTVDNGVGGEIVITTLNREASPKVRYRTGDFGYLEADPHCACGRHGARLVVKGRLRDAAQFGDKFRLPIDFEEHVLAQPDTTGLYRLTYKPLPGDKNEVSVHILADVRHPDDPSTAEAIRAAVAEHITPNVSVETTPIGKAIPELMDQTRFSGVRSAKTALLDDQRPQEWLVTY